tara:strand:- start:187 stop:723 length:537 start_codon:yes stop_codon:yes gene_type:complete
VDWLTFISNVSAALAWPLAIFLVAWMFRRPITDRLRNLQNLKGAGFEASFEAASEDVKKSLTKLAADRRLDGLPIGDDEKNAVQRVLSAWVKIEEQVERLAKRLPGEVSLKNDGLGTVLEQLVDAKIIGVQARNSVMGLSQMRNLAVHAPSTRVAEGDVQEFLALANAILYVLSQSEE